MNAMLADFPNWAAVSVNPAWKSERLAALLNTVGRNR